MCRLFERVMTHMKQCFWRASLFLGILLGKKKLVAFVLLLAAFIVCSASLAGCFYSPDFTQDPSGVPCLCIGEPTLVKNAIGFNGSFTLENKDGIDIPINELRINDVTLGKISGLKVYFNGTSINFLNGSPIVLKPGDTVYVNTLIPNEDNAHTVSLLKIGTFNVYVKIPDASFWRESTYLNVS